MGCDIHLYKEKKVDGVWVSADENWVDQYGEGLDVPYQERFTDRNYELFGFLSKGVRGEFDFSFLERGIPIDACVEVSNVCDGWGCDGHSHSYLYIHELKDAVDILKKKFVKITGMKSADQLSALRDSISSDRETDWNLLYPYCKWASNGMGYEPFEFDVPASFILGEALERIIAMFDGVDGENHRIVFWFDN